MKRKLVNNVDGNSKATLATLTRTLTIVIMALNREKFELLQSTLREVIAFENQLKKFKEENQNYIQNLDGLTQTSQTYQYNMGDGYTFAIFKNY